MQNTSATWKALFAAGARMETRAVIGGTEYTLMSNPVINRALMQGAFCIGNAVSATCQFSVETTATIPRASPVMIQMRLTDGATASEWIPAGTFFISRRQRDPVTGVLTLECYDAMLKANAALEESVVEAGPWLWTTDAGEQMITDGGDRIVFTELFPCDGAQFAVYAAALLGVTPDSRTTLQTGSAYIIDTPPAGTTVHDVLCLIAAQNGGNWIITPENKLRLVPLVSAADAGSAEDDVADVVGVLTRIAQRPTATVTGIRYTANDMPVILGDDTGLVIDTAAGAAIASDLYDALAGITYQAFTLEGAIYDPAAELGDYVRAGANGEIRSMLCAEAATLGALFTASISAPEGGEMSDEYPYIGSASNKALIASKAYTAQAVQSFNESLDQESVFNRLTDNGAAQGLYMVDGQLYVNMSYARTGTLVLGGLNNQNGILNVQDSSGNIVGRWTADGIYLDSGKIRIPIGQGGVINEIGINADPTVAAFRRAFYVYFQQNENEHICETVIDRGQFWMATTNASHNVSYGDVTITPAYIYMYDGGLGGSSPYIRLNTEATYYYGGSVKIGRANLRLYGDRVYATLDIPTEDDVTWFELNVEHQTMELKGSATFDSVSAGNGATGTFTTADGKTVTVTDGIITNIVTGGSGGHWLDYSVQITNSIGVIIQNNSVSNGIANISGYEYSAGYEGFNITMLALLSGHSYTLTFDYQTLSGGFFTGQYTFGYKISDRPVSSYPTSSTPDSSYTAFPRDFTKQSYSTTFTASTSEMYIIVAMVGYQDSGQNIFEMTNMIITENI